MHLPALISDLAVILLTGGFVTVIFKRLKQPVVLGYILTGFLIGPYMPFFFGINDMGSIKTWSEIGIIILMFGLGLEFNLHKLAKVGGTALITALTEVGGMLLLGYLAGQLMGWSPMDSIFLGGMLSMSSTTIIIKAFDELGLQRKKFAQLVFGTLIVEDIAGIFMMIVLSTISVSQNISGWALAMQLGLLLLYLALWLLLGTYLLPSLLKKMSGFMNDETLLVLSLGICFGMVLLADALGFSSALGAFLAGSLLAGTVHAERIEHITIGVKDLFGAVFFISVGMMLDPSIVVQYVWPILFITLLTLVGKFFFSALGTVFSGQTLENSIHCGASLSQIGEFAFIIASLGLSLGVIAEHIYPVIIAVSVITTLTTPFCIKASDKVYKLVCRILPSGILEKLLETVSTEQEEKVPDSDWTKFLKRYLRKTFFFGAILLGIEVLGHYLLLPSLLKLGVSSTVSSAVSVAAIYLAMALFVRPMMDMRATQTTVLWIKKRGSRLPITALMVIRILIIAAIGFIPLQSIIHVSALWFFPVALLLIYLATNSRGLASVYYAVEARFLANFNERQLQSYGEHDQGRWLDEQLRILMTPVLPEETEKELKDLDWGRQYSVNIIRIDRGRRHKIMPSGEVRLSDDDILYLIGDEENLRSFCLATDRAMNEEAPTLRAYLAQEKGHSGDLYSCAVLAKKQYDFAGKTIRDSRLRQKYDCMILGLQRDGLPIPGPHVDMTIQPGDLVWILGTQSMAERILSDATVE